MGNKRKSKFETIYYIRKEKTVAEEFYNDTTSLHHQRLMRERNRK